MRRALAPVVFALATPLLAGSQATATKAAIATSSPVATGIGLRVLQNGGNAADAAVAVGFALALPVILWQLWSFVAPAMIPQTQRAIAGFTVFAAALLVGGAVFGYRVALPAALHFLTNYDNSVYAVQVRAADFISFALLVLAACAAVFELPIVVLGLVRVRALTSKKLRVNRRIGYMIVAVIGVALPGVDPVTTIVETIPLAILFEASIWMSVVFERRWFTTQPAAETAG